MQHGRQETALLAHQRLAAHRETRTRAQRPLWRRSSTRLPSGGHTVRQQWEAEADLCPELRQGNDEIDVWLVQPVAEPPMILSRQLREIRSRAVQVRVLIVVD